MNCSTPGLPVHHQILEFTQTHIHQVSQTETLGANGDERNQASKPVPVTAVKSSTLHPWVAWNFVSCLKIVPLRRQARQSTTADAFKLRSPRRALTPRAVDARGRGLPAACCSV